MKKLHYAKTHVEVFIHFLKRMSLKCNTKTLLLFFVFACTAVFISCSDDDNNGQPHDPNKPVVLTTFTPDSGRIAEMMLLDGDNFGTDRSIIKVFFNAMQAVVINSTGSRILALVPRLPGDTCTIAIEIGDQRKEYANYFLYKIEASVSTIAGNGTDAAVYDQGLDKSQIRPVYIGIDQDYNIFATDTRDNLVRINVNANTIDVVTTGEQGFNHRCAPMASPLTNVLQMGAEGSANRDRFLFCDPKTGWIPKMYFIKEWETNGYATPTDMTHYACLLCEEDGNYYTRYNSGQLVRIDPATWKAYIVGMVPSGIAYGLAFHPINKKELWLAYDSNGGNVAHSICRVKDVTDETILGGGTMLASFEKLSGPTNGGHRDGPIAASQFRAPRMINFDVDGNLYVGDNGNHCIRSINTNTMMVETIIGIPEQRGFKDGNKDEALFSEPHGIVTDAEGIIYVSDFANNRIRRIAIE